MAVLRGFRRPPGTPYFSRSSPGPEAQHCSQRPYRVGENPSHVLDFSNCVCSQAARDEHEVIDCDAGAGVGASVIQPENNSHFIEMAEQGAGRNLEI